MNTIEKIYKIINQKYEKEEDFNKTYVDCKKKKDAESCYKFLIRWNRGIGILKSLESKKFLISNIKEILNAKIYNDCDFFLFINRKLNESVGNKKDLRVPTIKLFHILKNNYPLIDNGIAKYIVGQKSNYLQKYKNKPEKLFNFINTYKYCIDISYKKYFGDEQPNYKIIDEYLFLKIIKKDKNLKIDDNFENMIKEIKNCMYLKRKNKEIL